MSAAPTPADELTRLEHLWRYNVLDTPPEEAFDELTTLAARICAVPIAVLSLVDRSRAWFKSRVGLEATEIDRDVSFCAHAIHQRGLFVVPDALRDPRFAGNPFVTADPYVRFYAGVPLVTSEGSAIGVLCVLDRVPRELTAEQQQSLEILARHVMRLLGMRRADGAHPLTRSLGTAPHDPVEAALALSESEDRFRILAEASFEGIAITEKGVLLDLNDQLAELLGFTREELIGRLVRDFIAPEDLDTVVEAIRTSRLTPYEHTMLNASGGRFPVEVRARTARVGGREVRLTAIRDVTERRRADEALRASRDRLASLVRAAPVGIGIVVNRVFVEVNERICAMTGYARDELIGRNARVVYPSVEDYEAVGRDKYAQIRQSGVGTVETRWLRKDGSVLDILLSSSPIDLHDYSVGVTFSALDITERKRAEAEQERLRAQLEQAQKMESIGRLAGGVAHDFNNMLQAIEGNVDLALADGSGSEDVREYLAEIRQAAARSIELTRHLLAFARKQPASTRILDLNDTVSGMLRMLQRVIGEGIQIVWQPGSDVWPVNVDPAQIDRVLTNLTVNARDAIGEAGRITITTRNVTVGPDFPRADGAPGDYACLTVSDTGCGMEPEVLRHLFEPFFTTKEKGRGTGLGLSTVYGIVRQNGGFLDVASEPGAGTVLALYLPRAFAATGSAEAPALEATPARGAETVLLVEDEEQVLMLMRNVLARHGYTVLPASRPVDALALAERHDGPIHLILTDVVMPGMNGRELADRVAARRPGIRRLYVSGYTADVLAPQGVLDGSVQFLQKPFSLPDFVRKVREVLDAS